MAKHKESEEDRKSERKSAGVLLLLSRRAVKDAQKTVSRSVDEAVAEAARQTRGGNVRKAALFTAILGISRSLARDLGGSLVASRGRARTAGAEEAARELASLGIAVPTGFGTAARVAGDQVLAEAAADAVAASWRALAMSGVSRAVRREESVGQAVEGTRKTVLTRAELTARTEASRAYNEEHVRAVRDAAREDSDFAKELKAQRIVRVWSSVLEKNTCRICESHHGEVSDLDGSFDGGDEPGDVHVRCLCTSYLISEA
jgi:hypothetical protein